MTMKSKPSRLRAEINELAAAMHANGTLDSAAFEKITLRNVNRNEAVAPAPMTGEDIRALREQAHMSQAVLAKLLQVTTGHVSKLERGAVRPTGPALVLLDVIRRKGVEAIL